MEKKSQLLSNFIVTSEQRLILIIDDTGREKYAHRIIRQFLSEQGQDASNTKTLLLNEKLREAGTIARFLRECAVHGQKQNSCNVLLPTLADLLCYQRPLAIFEFLHDLRGCLDVQRSILWASTPHLVHPKVDYLLAACEYMTDVVVHILDGQNLRITTRKSGGGVTNKAYTYKIDSNNFLIQSAINDGTNEEQPKIINSNSNSTTQVNPENNSTFKIELEEEELVARNAMKLPYEKTSDETTNSGGSIVYTPDAADDFDEEDPDEDLWI